jgi:hypothetical protein
MTQPVRAGGPEPVGIPGRGMPGRPALPRGYAGEADGAPRLGAKAVRRWLARKRPDFRRSA